MAIGTPVGTAFVEVQGRLANNFQSQIGSRIGGVMAGVGRVAGLALAGGAVAGVAGIVKAVDAASDLGESINAVNVVFGDASGTITAFSETAAREVGLSARAINQMVTPIGAAFQNVGFDQQFAADASVELTKRAADMASVFNVDVAEALGAIQAGLRGEADPLERFGVGLSAANVEAFALKEGLIGVGGEMTEQIKAQARLGLLMEQTNKIQGDFANTSDSAANRQRILQASIENTSAKIGGAFLPIWEKILGGLLKFVDWAAPLVTSFINEQLIPAFAAMGAWWEANGPAIIEGARRIFEGIGLYIGVVVDVVKDVIAWFQKLGGSEGAEGAFSKVLAFAQETWPRIQAVISSAVELIRAVIERVITVVTAIWNSWGDEIMTVVGFVWDNVKTVISTVLDVISGIFDVFAAVFKGDWSAAWEALKGIFSTVWEGIKRILENALGIVVTIFTRAWEEIKKFFAKIWENIKSDLSRDWNAITTTVSDGIDRVLTFFRELPGKVMNFLKELPGKLIQFGKDLAQGILNGLGNLAADLFNKLKGAIGDAIANVQQFFGFGSPSKVMAKVIGLPLAQGIVQGFEQGLDSDAMLASTQRAFGVLSAVSSATPLQATGTDGSYLGAAQTNLTIALDDVGRNALIELVIDGQVKRVRQITRAG